MKRSITDSISKKNKRARAVYAKHPAKGDEATVTRRKDAVMLVRLKSSHSKQLAAYKHLMDPMTDPKCKRCGEDNETLVFWLSEFPSTMAARHVMFGGHRVDLSIMTEDPKRMIEVAKR